MIAYIQFAIADGNDGEKIHSEPQHDYRDEAQE